MADAAIDANLLDYVSTSRLAISLAHAQSSDHALVYVNDRFSDLTGYTRDEFLGRNCRFLQGNRRDQPGRKPIRAFLDDPAIGFARTTLVNFRKDGTPFANMLMMARLYDQAQTPRYIFASQFDIGLATSDRLVEYDTRLRDKLDGARKLAQESRLMMQGSLKALGDTAARIAQAKVLLSDFRDPLDTHWPRT